MLIKKVRTTGFERLFETYLTCKKENRQNGIDIMPLLRHSLVSIELQGITTIELFYLKKFCSSLKIIDREYNNFINQEKEFDVHQKVQGLLDIHDEMLKDDDINKNTSDIHNILPIGCEKYHVIAIFKGSAITSITGPFVDEVFKEENKLPDAYNGDLFTENKLAELFYNSFYRFISNQMTELNLVSDFMLNKKFYQYAESNCSLTYVNTIFGDIEFFGNTQDKLNYQINKIKSSQETTPYCYDDQTLLTFVLDTTFNTFMKLFLYTNYVIDYMNLKLVFIDENILLSKDIVSKYNARISNSVDYLISYKKGLNESTEIKLDKFNYIFNGNSIKYIIQIPLNEIDKFVSLSIDKEDELINIKSKIKDISKTIDQLVN